MTTEFSTEFLPAEEQAAPAAQGLSIKRLLQRRLPLMVVVAVVLAVPSVLAVWFLVPLEYQATASIRFEQTAPVIMFEDSRNDALRTNTTYERYIETHQEQITNPNILERVCDDPEIKDLPWFNGVPDRLAFLRSKVTTQRKPNTELVNVMCEARDRSTAILVVKKVVDEYMRLLIRQQSTTSEETREELLTQQKSLEQQLENQLARIGEEQKQLDALLGGAAQPDPTELQHYRESLSQAQAELESAETDQRRIEDRVTRLKALAGSQEKDPGRPIYDFGVEDRVSLDPAVQAAREELSIIDMELAALEGTYVSDAPQLKVKREARESKRRQVAAAENTARKQALETLQREFADQLAQATSAVQAAQGRATVYTGEVEAFSERAKRISEIQTRIEEMRKKADVTEQNLSKVESKIYQKDVESRAPASVVVNQEATAPQQPDYGKRLQYMLLALMASGFVGFGTGVWRELTDQQVRTTQDVGAMTQLPTIAAVPHASVDRLPSNANIAMLTAEHPNSTTADEFRRVLTRIIYPPEGSAELHTILVSSASRGDGKTSVSCNLAISLAHANRRVLLVDASSRRANVEEHFRLARSEGLAEVLAGGRTMDSVVRGASFPNLFVMGPGYRSEELVSKLASREMMEFLEQAEQAYEHVILDTPPALLMAEAKLLAPVADGVILVVGVNVSSGGMVKRCLRELRDVGANVIGVVLNGVRPTRGGYLAQNLEQYYSYADRRGPAELARPSSGYEASPPGAEDEPTIVLLDEDEGNDS